ncbi:MAG: hypothetical protein U1F36_13335 [Planctomycetota bacterium]
MKLVRPVAAVALLAAALVAQKQDKLPRWRIDPYTHNDPKLLEKVGYVSYGGFEFGQRGTKAVTTEDIDKAMPGSQILWVETPHFRLGSTLESWTVPLEPDVRGKIRGELTRLQERGFERINEKTRSLDPWLRLHLYAMRLEDHYAVMQSWLGVTDATFPKDEEDRKTRIGDYTGEGPFLGQKNKYLFLLFQGFPEYENYLATFTGRRTIGGQQWNFKDVDSLLYACAADNPNEDGRLKDDVGLHGHVVFSETHNLINGYLHYNFDLPVWMREAPAHWFERQISPRYNSFTRSEGAAPIEARQWRFDLETRKLLGNGKFTAFADIMKRRDFGEFDFPDHVTIWSRQDYLMSLGKEKFAKFMRLAKAQVDPLTGQTMGDIVEGTRMALREAYGLSPLSLEEKWRAWVLETYPTK